VLLTRLSPAFPFNLLNYAYGVTAVRPRDYIAASWLGMLPATVLYVYAGSAAANLAQALSGRVRTGRTGTVLLVVGLAATVAVTRAGDAPRAPASSNTSSPHERG